MSHLKCVVTLEEKMWMLHGGILIGCGRSSVITGSSVHKARIDRLWRHLRRVV